jgi:formylglycine-generating enzyme required for sulfatase activity
VTGIPWEGALKYCKQLGASAANGSRTDLPHEDEWEYAARGPRLQTFPWGNDPLDLQRTNAFAGSGKLKPVMTSDQDQTPVPDQVAIFDMIGNAREWTADLYREDKPPKSPGDESWVQDGNMSWRTVRGLPIDEKPQHGLDGYTAAYRSEMCGSGACPKGTEQRRQYVGFRCVRRGGTPGAGGAE